MTTKIVKTKIITVFMLIVLGIFQFVSGLVLYLTRGYGWGYGWGRKWYSYTAGVDRFVLKNCHFYCGLIIIAIVVIHFALNWKIFKAELKSNQVKNSFRNASHGEDNKKNRYNLYDIFERNA